MKQTTSRGAASGEAAAKSGGTVGVAAPELALHDPKGPAEDGCQGPAAGLEPLQEGGGGSESPGPPPHGFVARATTPGVPTEPDVPVYSLARAQNMRCWLGAGAACPRS